MHSRKIGRLEKMYRIKIRFYWLHLQVGDFARLKKKKSLETRTIFLVSLHSWTLILFYLKAVEKKIQRHQVDWKKVVRNSEFY